MAPSTLGGLNPYKVLFLGGVQGSSPALVGAMRQVM